MKLSKGEHALSHSFFFLYHFNQVFKLWKENVHCFLHP